MAYKKSFFPPLNDADCLNVMDTFLLANHHKVIIMINTGMWKQKK
jgi:hypothetical protein